MRSLFLAVMLIASMLLTADVAAAPKHQAGAKHTQNDASTPAETVSPEAAPPPDDSIKGKLGAMVTSMGGAPVAAQLHIDPAWLGLIVIALGLVVLLFVFMVLRAIFKLLSRMRLGKAVYAGDYSNSILGKKQEPRIEPNVKPTIKPVAARAAQQIAKSQAAARDHADFDVQKFLRSANSYFLRLQVAWDRGDLNDLKEFVTREIYVELKSQIKARGSAENKTNVDSVDVELLKLETGEGKYVATVKFSGKVREEDGPSTKFMEVWSLTRRIEGTNWRLAGIQQFA